MKTEALTSIGQKIAAGIATAVVLAGSGAIVTAARDNAVQDEKITQIEVTVQKIDSLDQKLDETLRKVDVLNARLDTSKETPNVPRK